MQLSQEKQRTACTQCMVSIAAASFVVPIFELLVHNLVVRMYYSVVVCTPWEGIHDVSLNLQTGAVPLLRCTCSLQYLIPTQLGFQYTVHSTAW